MDVQYWLLLLKWYSSMPVGIARIYVWASGVSVANANAASVSTICVLFQAYLEFFNFQIGVPVPAGLPFERTISKYHSDCTIWYTDWHWKHYPVGDKLPRKRSVTLFSLDSSLSVDLVKLGTWNLAKSHHFEKKSNIWDGLRGITRPYPLPPNRHS